MSENQMADEIQDLKRQIREIRDLLKKVVGDGADDRRAELVTEITALLEDVPDDRLQSVLDYVSFLTSAPGGDEDEIRKTGG